MGSLGGVAPGASLGGGEVGVGLGLTWAGGRVNCEVSAATRWCMTLHFRGPTSRAEKVGERAEKVRAMHVLLCRHGETIANSQGVLQGQSNSDLTDTGRAQAVLLGKEVAARALDPAATMPLARKVYTSDLGRALDTAQAVVSAVEAARAGLWGDNSMELVLDPRLRERRLGPLQGIPTDEARRRFPKTWAAFSSGAPPPQGAVEPGADANGGVEATAEMRRRAAEMLAEVASAPGAAAPPPGAVALPPSSGAAASSTA